LLHTNRVPTDFQIRDIINLIQVQQIQRSDIELERERLLLALERTAQTLVEVSDVISDLKATLSPIKRMPDEILALIFEHCLPKRSPDNPSFDYPSHTLPRLGLVCSSWRQIAHAHPRLWCNVDLNIHQSKKIFTQTLPRLLNWIHRSGSLPLSLTLRQYFGRASEACDGLDDVFNAIALHAPRWKTMCIHVQRSQFTLRSLSRLFAKSFTGLSTLDVKADLPSTGVRHDPGEPISFDFQKSPLRNLSLCLRGVSVHSVFVSCVNMTRLSLDLEPPDGNTSSLGELVGILHRCHSLEKCTLFLRASQELTPLPHVCLRHLQSLHIRIVQASEASNQLDDLLDVSSFPSLLILEITYCTPSEAPLAFPEQLNPFLRRHTSTLRRFAFSASSWAFDTYDFLEMIEGTSSITELEVNLHHSHSISPLIEVLTPVLDEGSFSCLLPHLEVFTFTWDKQIALPCIAEMAEMRWALAGSLHGIAQPKSITCKQREDMQPRHKIVCRTDNIRVRKLQERGVKLDFMNTSLGYRLYGILR
jgi:hypothetical protein